MSRSPLGPPTSPNELQAASQLHAGPGPRDRYRAIVAYDGTEFLGFQAQRQGGVDVRTVQGVLEEAISNVAVGASRVVAAGRTDAGVHASGQVVHFEVSRPDRLTVTAMRQAINAHLPSDVRVIAIERAEVGFHARFSARSRAYRYLIENGPHASPLLRRHVWHVSSRLDVGAMQEACLELVGLHDFVAFAAREASGPTIRRVFSARIDVLPATPWVGRQGDRFTEMWHNPLQLDLGESLCGRLLSIEIEANAFLRHMMRRIVGSLVRVGRGWMHPSELGSVLHRRVKADAGPAAPAHGLDLFRVGYDGANIEDMGRCDSA